MNKLNPDWYRYTPLQAFTLIVSQNITLAIALYYVFSSASNYALFVLAIACMLWTVLVNIALWDRTNVKRNVMIWIQIFTLLTTIVAQMV